MGLLAIKINFFMALLLGLGFSAAWRTSSTDANVQSANQQAPLSGLATTATRKPSEQQESLRLRGEIKVI